MHYSKDAEGEEFIIHFFEKKKTHKKKFKSSKIHFGFQMYETKRFFFIIIFFLKLE